MVAESPLFLGCCTWSPDSQWLYYEQLDNSSAEALYTTQRIHIETGEQVTLGADIPNQKYTARPSPDGLQLALITGDASTNYLWITATNGENPRNIAFTQGRIGTDVSWSMDSTRIAISDLNTLAIYIVTIETQAMMPLQVEGFTPTWSPVADRIVFSTSTSDESTAADIYVVNADGSGLINLTNSPETGDFQAQWSADGQMIAYVSAPEFVYNQSDNVLDDNVWLMNVETQEALNLTEPIHCDLIRGIAWSPDNHHIVFSCWQDTIANLWIVDIANANLINLTGSH
jgi:Tol biopolymer transport system component